jgi:hypothetical protein
VLSPYIFTGLEKNLETFRILAEAVPAEKLDAPTHPGRFTARQALAHWADWDAIHLWRLHAAIDEDGAPVPDVSEGERAIEKAYDSWPMEKILGLFDTSRRQLIDTLSDLTNEQLERRFVHSFFGELSIADYAGHVLGHDAYHAEQLLHVVLPD